MPYIGKEPAKVPVTAADIPDNSITAAKIVDGAITIADIADDAVTEDKLANAINTAIAANTAKVTNATHTGDVTGATALTFDIALSVTSDKGCVNDTIINNMITAYPITNADFTFTPGELDENNNLVYFSNQSRGEDSWLWKYDDGGTDGMENPEHRFLSVGDHSITLVVNNQYNCMDSITKNITQKPVWSYHIPNAFTPNGDGKNEIFFATAVGIKDFSLKIFNRWGEIVFESKNYQNDWGGTCETDLCMGNRILPEGTYFYLLDVQGITFKGYVTIKK